MASIDKFQSDVVLGSVQSGDLGYGVAEVVVTMAAGMEMGSALELVGGKYIHVVAANVANTVGILIDTRAQGYDEVLADGDHTLVVAFRGHTIAEQEINLADSVVLADIQAAAAAFEAAGANKVTDKVLG